MSLANQLLESPSTLVAVQLETCHANSDGTAWYAYFKGEPVFDQQAMEQAAQEDGAPLGLDFEEGHIEEVPSSLSKAAGMRRFYIGSAC